MRRPGRRRWQQVWDHLWRKRRGEGLNGKRSASSVWYSKTPRTPVHVYSVKPQRRFIVRCPFNTRLKPGQRARHEGRSETTVNTQRRVSSRRFRDRTRKPAFRAGETGCGAAFIYQPLQSLQTAVRRERLVACVFTRYGSAQGLQDRRGHGALGSFPISYMEIL